MTDMSAAQLLETAKKRLVYVTDRPPVVMQRGEGMYLFDTEGKRYLDFFGGCAVTALGHCPPVLVKALKKQAEILVNCSPGFFNTGRIAFADLLVRHSCFDQAWFGNTGAEVNEAAIKMARKYGSLHRMGAYEIITTEHSFHGRTLATMSATGKPQWAALFEPKAGGFIHVPFNDLQAIHIKSSRWGERTPPKLQITLSIYFLVAPRRRPRPATVFLGPLRVRAFVRVRCPRTGKLRRCRMPR